MNHNENVTTPLTLEEYEPQLWSCLNCYCGICVESCPSYRELKNEIVSARGLAQIGLALLSGDLKPEALSDEILFACSECRWCEWVCSMNMPVTIRRDGTRNTKVSGATMVELLRALKIEQGGKVPTAVRDALSGIAKYGNPYGASAAQKDQWVVSCNRTYSGEETILYVGPTVPYEALSTDMALAVMDVLSAGGISFSLLGSLERETGAFSRMLGEEGLFVEMVEHTVAALTQRTIKRIICLSPHDYDALKRYYRDLSGVEIFHYTQIIASLLDSGTLKFTKRVDKRLAYHDPCYLSRQHAIFREPRTILQSIPGVKLVEMKRSGEESYCCGGGGAGIFLDLEKINIGRARAEQIREVNPQGVVVACPLCYQMLEAALKSENLAIEVMDIARVVKQAL